MRVAPVPAAISEIKQYGPVTVAHAVMMWADAADGWAIVGRSGELVPLWTPPQLDGDPSYLAFKHDHPDASLWTDSITWPQTESLVDGGERLNFALTLKNCRACAILGHAQVAYSFSPKGNLTSVHLVRLTDAPR